MSFCIVTMIGRVGQEPKPSMTQSGKATCTFSMAFEEGYKDNKKTIWMQVSVFGQQAEICNKWVHQGASLAVTGRLGMNEYTDKNGQKVQRPQVIAEHIEFLSSKPMTAGGGGYNRAQVPPPAQQNMQYGQQQGFGGAPLQGQSPLQGPDTPPEGMGSGNPETSF